MEQICSRKIRDHPSHHHTQLIHTSYCHFISQPTLPLKQHSSLRVPYSGLRTGTVLAPLLPSSKALAPTPHQLFKIPDSRVQVLPCFRAALTCVLLPLEFQLLLATFFIFGPWEFSLFSQEPSYAFKACWLDFHFLVGWSNLQQISIPREKQKSQLRSQKSFAERHQGVARA